MKKKIVLIGGGGASLFSGATVMQMAPNNFEVSMISNEGLFCRCSGPYVLKKRAAFKDAIMPDTMITQFGINLLKGTVKSINHKTKEIIYGDDIESHKENYDILVFGTGARPFLPPIDGHELKNVFTVRTPDDIKGINSITSKAKRATVIGGGVIGVEMASALKERGLKVDMLILETNPFERLADTDFTSLIKEKLLSKKINILEKSMILKIEGKNKVEKVIYKKAGLEYELKSEMVIFATGVRANKELAEEIGVKTSKLGILVDDYMRTNLKDVYAAGDCSIAKSCVNGQCAPSQLASNAVIQGKIVGKNIIGMKTKYPGHTSATVLGIFDMEFGIAGFSENDCVNNKLEYYTGYAKSTDIYQDLKGVVQVDVKLIFNKKTNRIIGVQAYGRNLIWIINLISYAIMQKSTIFDLVNLDYASHPSVSAWPFMNPIILACESAMMKMQKK
ncbi:MAG: FAD-dependent oxidoreductase [Candidatus Woesearchaeota archaeon]|jgi:NADH oxidase (H2O2-forming)|nr:FAD-dependent oxidoreductase [Candidatus Woesearchaeota archaeon]